MKTTIENPEFPSDIKKRLKMKISRTNLNIEFLSDHIIKFNQINISVRESHRIIISNSKNTIIALLYDDIEKIYEQVIAEIQNGYYFNKKDNNDLEL